ncbi:MAG TPA: GNAT family N-acetyltransferase [Rhabdochlamydiaceae bacterium]|jgi:predicted GNAT family acetyltransferase
MNTEGPSCEKVTSATKDELIYCLKNSEEYALFLLSNLETYGLELSDALYSGTFKVVREGGQFAAAFCLTKKGTLLVHSDKKGVKIYDAIIQSCLEEKIPISGALGKWSFAWALWNALKQKGLIQKETFIEKEVLYTLDLKNNSYLPDPDVRLMQARDFEMWVKLREAYVQEMGFPAISWEEMREEFMIKVAQKISWGLFIGDQLVAIADLNAHFADLGQLGGVYTVREFRKQGFSTRLVRHLVCDCKALHRMRKLIIFTGENNLEARRVYESMGIIPYGEYALLFGVPQ